MELAKKIEQEAVDFRDKSVVLWRGGAALGDMVQCTPLFSRIKKAGAKSLAVYCWPNNRSILENNPYIDEMILWDKDLDEGAPEDKRVAADKAWQEKVSKYDLQVNLAWTVEGTYLSKSDFAGKNGEFMGLQLRQGRAKGLCWFEEMARAARLDIAPGDKLLPELYFTQEEDEELEKFISKKRKSERWILWQPVGSALNKVFFQAIPFIKGIADKFINSKHFIAGNFSVVLDHDRMIPIADKWPFRKLLNLMRGMDGFMGCESALANASGAECYSSIPKLIYYTHGWPESISKNFTNCDYVTPRFTQKEKEDGIACYPCHLIPINYAHTWEGYKSRFNAIITHAHCMEYEKQDPFKPLAYRCVTHLPLQDMAQKVVKMLR